MNYKALDRALDYLNYGIIDESFTRQDIAISNFLEPKDSCYNLNLFGKNNENILYITGISGSGKSTLSNDLKDLLKCGFIELDYISAYYLEKTQERNLYDKFYNALKSGCPEAVEFFDKNSVNKYGTRKGWDETADIVKDFDNWFYKKVHKNNKLYILCGAQISYYRTAEYFKNKPLIIKEINYSKSCERRIERESDKSKEHIERIKKKNKFLKDDIKILQKFKKDMDKIALVTESKDASELSDIDPEIIAFNKELNSWKYGVLINGKVYTKSDNIDWSKYKTIPIDQMKKYHVGVCWDFVNYEYAWFKEKHIKTEAYLFVMQLSEDVDDIVTHTFLLFLEKGKKYWFESSWFGHQWIKKVNGFKDVVEELVDRYGNHAYSVYKYNPEGMDKNLSNGDFFRKATRNLVFDKKAPVNESKDASELDSNFKKKSDLHFKILDMKSSSANKYVPKEWKDEFNYKAKDAAIVVCKEDDELAGFIYWNPKSGTIGPLKVYTNYRGYGISELLLKAAIDGGGYKLGVYEDNKVAYNLYKKMGFKEVDRKEYADGDVAIMMELNKK